jgi:hypothetical protein
VTPQSGSATWSENTTGHKVNFTVTNPGPYNDLYNNTCSATGDMVCNGLSQYTCSLLVNRSCTVTLRYSVGAVGSGTVSFTSTDNNAGAQNGGTYTITVSAGPPEVAVTTYHNDALRTGWNQHEQTLTPTNVAPASFGSLYSISLDDQVDAQPLVVPHVTIAGGTHDVVYVATENNTIYAIEPATGNVLLSRNFANLGPSVARSNLLNQCDNNGPNVGINSTPVIDSASNTMYVMTYTWEAVFGGTAAVYRIHALDLSTLQDKVGLGGGGVLVAVSDTLPGGAILNFSATYHRQRPALLEANGNIYAAFGSWCDHGGSSSRGWVLGWQTGSLNMLPHRQLNNLRAPSGETFLSAIWMSGYGVAADNSGYLYFLTGNSQQGTYDPTGYTNIQESAVRLSPDLATIQGLFTPSNHDFLDAADSDFSSGGLLVLPDNVPIGRQLAVAAGKTTGLFLLNRYSGLGLVPGGHAGPYAIGGPCWCGESYYAVDNGGGRVVTSGGSSVMVWQVGADIYNAPLLSLLSSTAVTSGNDPGFFTSVSSSGTLSGTAIIWAVSRPTSYPGNMTLYAINPANGSTLFSATAGSWADTNANPNIVPVVANGLIFVASNKQLSIFGLN